MSQQSFGMRAGPSAYSMDSRDERNIQPSIKDPTDTLPTEKQPPRVDEQLEYNSLEEALTGS